jgi:type IV pilus assembly protein PilM
MKLFSLNFESFGLDISDLCLRVVKLKKKGSGLELAYWKEMKLEPGIIQNGEIINEEKMINAVGELTKDIKTKYVIACLPESKSFLQVIKMPEMSRDELVTAVPFEAENYIPFSLEDVYLDFEIISGIKEEGLNVLIAAVPREVVDSYVSCLKRAGLSLKALEVESQSISRALIKNNVSNFPILIIDFGASSTSFIIFSGYSLRFTSSITVSSSQLTEVIAKEMKIKIGEAEKLKIKNGLKKSKDVFKAMSPLIKDLTEQSQKYINYYSSHGGSPIKKILLCGKGSNLKGLVDFISAELGLPVELANPWVNIMSDKIKTVPKLPFEESLGYTTALGLALRDIYD